MTRVLAVVIGLLAVLQPVKSEAQVASPWIISPGFGLGPITLGMRATDVNALLGPPTAFCVLSFGGQEKDNVLPICK
jgi:hypothetical protein